MEFRPTDHASEKQLKLDVITAYNQRLDEREKRKRFVIEHNLLDYKKNINKKMVKVSFWFWFGSDLVLVCRNEIPFGELFLLLCFNFDLFEVYVKGFWAWEKICR